MDFIKHGISTIVSGKHFANCVKLIRMFDLPYIVMCDKDALMNIEGSINVGEKIETSPVFSNIWKNKSRYKNHINIIVNYSKKIEVIDGVKKYPEELFEELQHIAKKYGIFVLSSDFEGVLEKNGYLEIINEAKRTARSKVIRGKLVAEKILEETSKVPKEFENVIDALFNLLYAPSIDSIRLQGWEQGEERAQPNQTQPIN